MNGLAYILEVGRVALVTGTGQGFGQAIELALAERGAQVIAVGPLRRYIVKHGWLSHTGMSHSHLPICERAEPPSWFSARTHDRRMQIERTNR